MHTYCAGCSIFWNETNTLEEQRKRGGHATPSFLRQSMAGDTITPRARCLLAHLSQDRSARGMNPVVSSQVCSPVGCWAIIRARIGNRADSDLTVPLRCQQSALSLLSAQTTLPTAVAYWAGWCDRPCITGWRTFPPLVSVAGVGWTAHHDGLPVRLTKGLSEHAVCFPIFQPGCAPPITHSRCISITRWLVPGWWRE